MYFFVSFFFVLSDRDYTLTGKTLGITNGHDRNKAEYP